MAHIHTIQQQYTPQNRDSRTNTPRPFQETRIYERPDLRQREPSGRARKNTGYDAESYNRRLPYRNMYSQPRGRYNEGNNGENTGVQREDTQYIMDRTNRRYARDIMPNQQIHNTLYRTNHSYEPNSEQQPRPFLPEEDKIG